MDDILASEVGIVDFRSMKIHAPRMTNELVDKLIGNCLRLQIYYFEAVSSDGLFEAEGTIIRFNEEIYIIDDAFGYIMKYIPSSNDIKHAYKISKFNWPSDNVKASRAGLVSDFLLDWFGLDTQDYLENPKTYTNIELEVSHILKIKYLFDNPDFRLNDKVDKIIFDEWLQKQPEYQMVLKASNKEWYDNSKPVTISGELKVDLTELETILKEEHVPDQIVDQVETAKIYYGGNSDEFKEFATDIPLCVDASGSSEDTVRVYKEFDLGNSDWELDYVYSFRYNSGAYLMKLKTTVLGKIECYLMVLHGTQWEGVQLNDLMLDIRSDCKKGKAALIETYKKEIMKFIDFFEVV